MPLNAVSESTIPSPVAVIDIGSNSIKLLVAAAARDGSLVSLAESTKETRIGCGLAGQPPVLQSDAMERAIEWLRDLLCEAGPFQPEKVCIVATSAVRDASNGQAFAEQVDEATHYELEILSGAEEAAAIARGVHCDPRLPLTDSFYLFDLGGGSLELLALRSKQVEQMVSLPLGCVRLTEKFIPNPTAPLPAASVAKLRTHVRRALQESGFRFDLPASAAAVATGGTATTWRAIRAAEAGVRFNASDPVLPSDELETWAHRFSNQSMEERRQTEGLPTARADVFPVALWTLVEVAQGAGARSLHHSLCNLRFGLAARLLFDAD